MVMISAVINTRNEEKNLPACLDALRWCDECVVVDMESDDATVAIASERGARVFSCPNVGYVEPARAFAVEQARGNWVLIVDADELVPRTLADRLCTIAGEDACDVVAIPHKNFLLGEWIRHSGWWPDYHWRFFRRGAVRFSDRIHGPVEILGRPLRLPAEEPLAFVHLHHADLAALIDRINRYTTIEAGDGNDSGMIQSFRMTDLWLAPLRQFVARYLRQGGYRAGFRGLFLALLMAFYELATAMKRWEQQEYRRTCPPADRYAAERAAVLAEYGIDDRPTTGDRHAPSAQDLVSEADANSTSAPSEGG